MSRKRAHHQNVVILLAFGLILNFFIRYFPWSGWVVSLGIFVVSLGVIVVTTTVKIKPPIIKVNPDKFIGMAKPLKATSDSHPAEELIIAGTFDYLLDVLPLHKDKGGPPLKITRILGRMFMGRPPRFYIVDQCEWSDKPHGLITKNSSVIRRWKLDANGIVEIGTESKLGANHKHNRFYYNYGTSSFYIRNDGQLLRIGWLAGPLFGVGVEWTIETQGDTILMKNPNTIWKS